MIHEIKRLIHDIKELPFLIEEVENWRNEMNDILNEISRDRQKDLYDIAHGQLMKALNEAERLKQCLQGNIEILHTYAALISTNKINELMQIIAIARQPQGHVNGGSQEPVKMQDTTPAGREADQGLELKTFKVLETNRKQIVITRAWCQTPDGNRAAVLSEGEVGEAFAKSKSNVIKVWCSREGKEYKAKKLA